MLKIWINLFTHEISYHVFTHFNQYFFKGHDIPALQKWSIIFKLPFSFVMSVESIKFSVLILRIFTVKSTFSIPEKKFFISFVLIEHKSLLLHDLTVLIHLFEFLVELIFKLFPSLNFSIYINDGIIFSLFFPTLRPDCCLL
jgi:hypothetical protein